MNDTHCEHFHIAASHPALPGHFPGNPVVPGVMLLDRVCAAAERAWGASVRGFVQVKFVRPLAPDEDAELVLERAGNVRFRIQRGEDVIASGSAELAP